MLARSLAAGFAALTLIAAPAASASVSTRATVKIILSGDVMLGRGVAGLAAREPSAVFGGVRVELGSADLTVVDLESPLTTRRHLWFKGPNALEAKPATARILKQAGFDAMAIANNHAGDAGPATVPDTMHALAAVGLPAIGAGRDLAAAFSPVILTAHGLRVAFLSFDDTGEGPHAGVDNAGVAWWDPVRARAAVARARAEANVVVVGLHGGSDYDPTTDPWLLHLGRLLSSWGVDIVWGTGPHVVQPTEVLDQPDGHPTVVATSLGNLLFDQSVPGTRTGELLEVLAGASGVRAYRLGATAQLASNAVDFTRWLGPRRDAVALDGQWWNLVGRLAGVRPRPVPSLRGFPVEHVAAAAVGDPVGDGTTQVAVSFWRPFRETDVNALLPRRMLVDRRGLTNHLGIYTPGGGEIWVAGTVLQPVRSLAACDGSLAVGLTTLNHSAVVATDAWVWSGFGFSPLPSLPGAGVPACADVGGQLDPIILGRRT